jgi:putative NADH-flavin reductase
MRVVIFGADGPSGLLLSEGALSRGHQVTVLLRRPQKLSALKGDIHVVSGDVADGGAVSDAVDGQEATLVALADPRLKPRPESLARATLNIIRSMQRYKVRRLVVLSVGSTHPGRDPHRPWLAERLAKPLLHGKAAADLRRAEVNVRQSELDWTLVRAQGLSDGPARGRYRVGPGFSLPDGASIGRRDLAAFMLDELEHGNDVGHALAIAY